MASSSKKKTSKKKVSKGMNFILKIEGDEGSRIYFPVLPAEFTVTTKHNNTTVQLTNFGEINLLGHKDLQGITFESFFPHAEVNYQRAPFRDPEDLAKKIVAMESHVCRFIITTTDFNKLMTVESFDYGRKDGTGDISYTIELKEYKKPRTTAYGSSGSKRTTASKNKKYCRTKKGDTLKKIAKRYLGSASKASTIYKLNQNTVNIYIFRMVGQTTSGAKAFKAKWKKLSKSPYNVALPSGMKLKLPTASKKKKKKIAKKSKKKYASKKPNRKKKTTKKSKKSKKKN